MKCTVLLYTSYYELVTAVLGGALIHPITSSEIALAGALAIKPKYHRHIRQIRLVSRGIIVRRKSYS